MKLTLVVIAIALLLSGIFFACRSQNTEKKSAGRPVVKDKINTPDWVRDAVIYELNVRQFSPTGDFAGVFPQIQRIKALGVDIVWLMPINPIGKKNRKEPLGSFYAVSDYKAVNPEFGNFQQFKALVDSFHAAEIKVIIDWVPNHTARDHPWTISNPDYYTMAGDSIATPLDQEGKPTDWWDVAELNYDNQEMRAEMIDAMQYWLREADIDGYRCDMAGGVPDDFWLSLRPELEKIKSPIFVLAESENKGILNQCFEANYGWKLHHLMEKIAKGSATALAIDTLLIHRNQDLPERSFQMNFTTNHDENSWNGTEFEKFDLAADVFSILAFTFDGMPLIYNGQESVLDKRIKFFERDPIDWKNYERTAFYQQLTQLKKRNRALDIPPHGGQLEKIKTDKDEIVYAFMRQKGKDKVIVVLNLSRNPTEVTLQGDAFAGEYTNVFGNSTTPISANQQLTMKPWDYLVLERR